ncbi:MAG: DMP19 family protein [Nitrospirota bacterium]|nr:DMP19 family protein [Nitrospirota bacterium]
MSRKVANLAKQLADVGSGTASFEVRCDLENYLLEELRSRGADEVIALLKEVPGLEIGGDPLPDASGAIYLRARIQNNPFSITLQLSSNVISVNVSPAEAADDASPEANPCHTWFYGIWQKLIETGALNYPENLQGPERVVAYIGILESEIMNGGLGQYLANTEGEYVAETLQLLKVVKATHTRSALSKAVGLKGRTETFGEAWASKARAFDELDAKITLAPEDLAELVAMQYQFPADRGPA